MAPTGLTATAGNTQVTLDWNDNSEGDLAGYNVYRSTTSGGPYSKVNGPLVTASTYIDTGLTNGTIYYYVVTAVDTASNESGYSNTASATTPPPSPPAAPSNLTATAFSSSRINLAWTDNSSNETNFRIERSTNNVNFTQVATVGANVKTYSNTGLTSGTTYYYRVRAFNAGGNSAYSNTASATPI